MNAFHDTLSLSSMLTVASILFVAGLLMLAFIRSTKQGMMIATMLSLIFMTVSSFFWSLTANGTYSRYRYGFPHFVATKNYDFSHEAAMRPLHIHYEYLLVNLWFWFSVCLFYIGLFKIIKHSRRPLNNRRL